MVLCSECHRRRHPELERKRRELLRRIRDRPHSPEEREIELRMLEEEEYERSAAEMQQDSEDWWRLQTGEWEDNLR